MVNKPRSDLGAKTLFEMLIKSLEDTNNRAIKDHSTIRNLRDSASHSIKVNKKLILSNYLNSIKALKLQIFTLENF